MNPTTAIHTYLTTAPESRLAGQPVSVLDHWQGRDNLLWRVEGAGREAVLKLFPDAGQVRSRRQYNGQQMFHGFGFAPRPQWYDWQPQGLPRPVLVYDWVDGVPLDGRDPALLGESARILAQVHNGDVDDLVRLSPNPVNFDYFWRLLAVSIDQIDGWLAAMAVPAMRARFASLSAAASTLAREMGPMFGGVPPTAIHGEPRWENWVAAGGTVTLLDWERFGLGDAALEVAEFLHLGQAILDETAQAIWLDAYLGQAQEPGLDQRIALYRRLLPFQSVCFLLDGLRQWTADLDDPSKHADERPFLAATLAAALEQAADRLQVEPAGSDAGVAQVMAFLRDPRSPSSAQ